MTTTPALLSLRFTRTDQAGNVETLSLIRFLSTGALAVQLRADAPPHDPDDVGTVFGFTGHQPPQHIGAGCVARHDQVDASLFELVPGDRLFGHEAEAIARAIALPGEDFRICLSEDAGGISLLFSRIFAGWASPTLTLAPWRADVATLAEAATEAAQDRFDTELDAKLPGWIEASYRAAIEGDETDVIKPATSCPACPIVRSAGHGYASDLDALRAIVTLYSEAVIDACRAYYAEPCLSDAALVALERKSDLGQAASGLVSAWAAASTSDFFSIESRLADLLTGRQPRDLAWFTTVVSDVRARLSGEMSRPLPASPAPEQVVAEAEKPEVWIGGEFLQREPPEPLPMADEAPVSPAPTTRPSIRPGEPEAAARASLPPPADDEPIGLGILGELR